MAGSRHPLLAPRVLVRGLALITVLAVGGWLFNHFGLKSMLETAWIDSEIRGQGLRGEILFLLLGAASTAVGVPRQVIAFLSGYAFGIVEGTALALLSALLGASLTFGTVRMMGHGSALLKRAPQRLQRVQHFLSTNTLSTVLVLRLFPFSSNLLTNIAAALAQVRFVPFLTATAIGYLPQTLIFALLGGGLDVDPLISTVVSAVLFVCSTVLGLWLWRTYRTQHGLPSTDDDEAA